jgi:hypothetical protein
MKIHMRNRRDLFDDVDVRKIWALKRRSGRTSFSALRRALISPEKLDLKALPVPDASTDNWCKTFSTCDQDGDRLLVLEMTLENTVPIAGTVSGIAFELFRTRGINVIFQILMHRSGNEEGYDSILFYLHHDLVDSGLYSFVFVEERLSSSLAIGG